MYDSILVPTDGSDGAITAAAHAIELAQVHDATIHVLYVVDVRMSPISSGMDREEVMELLDENSEDPTAAVVAQATEAGVDSESDVQVGVPYEAICEYADVEGMDVIVMGTHGRTGIDHALFGSTTERVVRTAGVPVVSVHIDDE
jgi:nucleotide-binding universal stress UspA family protein